MYVNGLSYNKMTMKEFYRYVSEKCECVANAENMSYVFVQDSYDGNKYTLVLSFKGSNVRVFCITEGLHDKGNSCIVFFYVNEKFKKNNRLFILEDFREVFK